MGYNTSHAHTILLGMDVSYNYIDQNLLHMDHESHRNHFVYGSKDATGKHGLIIYSGNRLFCHVWSINVGGAGCSERSFCIDGHHLGQKNVAIIQSRGWPQNRGDVVGTKVSGHQYQSIIICWLPIILTVIFPPSNQQIGYILLHYYTVKGRVNLS